MRPITIIVALCLTTTGALAAETSCKAQATDTKLAGAALTSFMKTCESDAEKACETSAAENKLAAAETLARIAALYRIESEIRGRSANERRAVRHERS
jgi:hypothetical protein